MPPSITTSEAQSAATHRSALLRRELKEWERTFAASHRGRKATREEIKNEVGVAAKYREYNNLRDVISGKVVIEQGSLREEDVSKKQPHTPSKKRKRDRTGNEGTSQSDAPVQTQDENEENQTPKKQFIAPTPQRDGRVLGLFDRIDSTPRSVRRTTSHRNLRTAAGSCTETPTRRQPLRDRTLNVEGPQLRDDYHENAVEVASTPSKPPKSRVDGTPPKALPDALEATPTNPRRQIRTPPSTGRRFMLQNILSTSTPSLFSSRKRKRETDTHATPMKATDEMTAPGLGSSDFATPAFLRTRPRTAAGTQLDAIPEEEEEEQGTPSKRVRMLRRSHTAPDPVSISKSGRNPFGRSLSQLMRDIRKDEDDRFDEEQAIFNEAEVQMEQKEDQNTSGQGQQIFTDDSQATQNRDEVTVSEAPSRPWKKKGAKRQTRRVLLKPKPAIKPLSPVPEHLAEDSSIENKASGKVAETQLQDQVDSDQDCGLPPDVEPSEKKRKKSDKQEDVDNNRDKSKKRKLNPLAHTNFTKLKIRGKGKGPKNWRRK